MYSLRLLSKLPGQTDWNWPHFFRHVCPLFSNLTWTLHALFLTHRFYRSQSGNATTTSARSFRQIDSIFLNLARPLQPHLAFSIKFALLFSKLATFSLLLLRLPHWSRIRQKNGKFDSPFLSRLCLVLSYSKRARPQGTSSQHWFSIRRGHGILADPLCYSIHIHKNNPQSFYPMLLLSWSDKSQTHVLLTRAYSWYSWRRFFLACVELYSSLCYLRRRCQYSYLFSNTLSSAPLLSTLMLCSSPCYLCLRCQHSCSASIFVIRPFFVNTYTPSIFVSLECHLLLKVV